MLLYKMTSSKININRIQRELNSNYNVGVENIKSVKIKSVFDMNKLRG